MGGKRKERSGEKKKRKRRTKRRRRMLTEKESEAVELLFLSDEVFSSAGEYAGRERAA